METGTGSCNRRQEMIRSQPVTTQPKEASTSRPASRQSSTGARKSLPPIPDGPSIPNPPSALMIDRPNLAFGDTNFQPFFLEYALMSEYNMIQKDKIPGVYVVPSAKTALVWNGVLFVRQGIYQDGVFRFTVNIPANFPDCDCPSITFTPPVFHPIIDSSTGNLDVVRAFHRWRRNVNHLRQILVYARRIFFKIETNEPLNQEAADLYENSPDLFKQRAVECIQRLKETLHNDPDPTDAHAIRFSPWDEAIHGPAKQQMFGTKP